MNKDTSSTIKASKNTTKNKKNGKSTLKTKKPSKTYIKQTGCWGPDLSSKQLHELNELFGNNK